MRTARDRFIEAMAAQIGGDASLPQRSGVTVQPAESRAERKVTAGYLLGEHLVITCDPAMTDRLRIATASIEPTLDAWIACGATLDGEHLGGARMQTIASDAVPDPAMADGYVVAKIDVHDEGDRARIQGLVDASSADDLDEAELEMDNLDEIFHAALDGDGAMVAFASARPWDDVENFGDIGVLTHSAHRGRGVGRAAVVALCRDLAARGIDPLYRCDDDNAGSVRLSESMGFEIATQLQAFRFATD